MPEAEKPGLVRQTLRFALAAVLVIAAFSVHQFLVLRLGMKLPPFIIVSFALMVDASFFGLWAGLMATVLAAALVDYWILEPIGQFRIERVSDCLALALFFLIGIVINLVAEAKRRSQRRLAAVQQELAVRETREELEKASAYRNLALEAAELGAWDYRIDTGEVVWDERCRNLFGLTAGDRISYEGALACMHPEDRTVTNEAIRQAAAGVDGGVFHQEFRVVWPDGSTHWISSHGRAHFDGEGSQRRALRFIGVNSDITWHRQNDEDLRASEERYRLLAETMLQGVVHQDAAGRIIAMNPAAERILGWTHEQYLGRTSVQVDALTVREDGSPLPGNEHPAMVALQTGRPVDSLVMGVWNETSNSRRWINVTAVPLFRPGQSSPYQVYTVFEDITGRKQAESAQQTTLQRFYAILSNLNSALLLVTDEGRVEFANPAFCERFGLAELPAALAGIESGAMIEKIRRAYRDPDEALARIQEIVSQGKLVIGEELPMNGGGTSLRDFVPLIVDGKSYGRLWAHVDITDRKRTEMRLRRFYETDLFAILYWRIDGGVVEVNDRFLKMTGYTREDVRAGLVNWADMTPPEYWAADEKARSQVRETGIHQPYEKEFIRKDGSRVWGQFWAAAYEDDRSQGVSFILDISERKRAENELRQAERDWERTFDSVPDLIAILDNQHRIVRANRAMAQRLSVAPDACIGLQCFACVHGTNAPIATCPHVLTLRDGLEHAAELHEDRLGGDFLVTTTPLFDERGQMDGTVHVARDITERMRAEEALREREEELRVLAHNLVSAVALINARGELSIVNKSFLDIFDLDEHSSILNINSRDWSQWRVFDENGRLLDVDEHPVRQAVLTRLAVRDKLVAMQSPGRTNFKWLLVSAEPILDGDGNVQQVICTYHDISERKQAEEALKESEKRYRNLFNAMNEGFCIVEVFFDENGKPQDYRFLEVNDAFEGQTGLHDVVGKCMRALAPAHEEHWFETYGRIAMTGEPAHFMNEAKALERFFDVHAYRVGRPDQRRVAIVFNDFSDYMRAEAALRESEHRFRLALTNAPVSVAVQDRDLVYRWAYNQHTRSTGEILGKTDADLFAPEDIPAILEAKRKVLETGKPVNLRHWITSNGKRLYLDLYYEPTRNTAGEIDGIGIAVVDLTETKLAEEALRASETKHRLLVESINDPFFAMDKDLRVTFWSQRTAEFNGVPAAVALGKTRLELFGESESQRKSDAMCRLCLETQKPVKYEVQWTFGGNSRLFDVQIFPYADGVATIGRDITERRQAEQQLQKLNRTLQALSNCNQALLHSADEAAFLREVCRIVNEDCGYLMVWIGFAEDDEHKSVRPVAWSGFEDGYLKRIKLTWDTSPTGLGPTGTAIRTGMPSLCCNMNTDPAFAPWREEATKRGYASSLVIPLKQGDKAIGVITIYSGNPNAFSESEVSLLSELAGDLAFGIHTLRLRAAHAEAEAALRESEEQLGLFVEHAPVALAMFDNEMRYLRVSRRWRADYALGDRALRGLSHYDIFPEISNQWREMHRRGLAGEILSKDADRFERADGSAQWLRWEIRPWNNHQGQIGGILIFSEEITHRKLAEDALREQAELLDLAHDTIMVCDLDGTIRFWNLGAQEMYGYSRDEAIGRKAHELLSTVFPKTRVEVKAQLVNEGRWEGELAQVARDGKGMMVDSRWVLQRDKDGQIRGVMEINNDITTRVKAEQAQREAHLKLQAVLDSITDGLLTLDGEWRHTYCSDHGARILGVHPEDLVGGCVWDQFPHTRNSAVGDAYRRAVESRKPVHFEEFYPAPLNKWLECHCYPTDEGLSVYFRDISERKRTEEALLRSEKLASVGRMAATIAHEINNPLAAITNTLYLARMRADDPESVCQFLDVADDELKRIAHITRQTLGFYRESSSPVTVRVNVVLESAVDLMKSKIGARRAVIVKEWEEQLNISAIAGELRQVFSNLLGNSLDAIGEGGIIKLRVAAGHDFKDGHRTVRITVADNGKGISASSKPHIFDPFFTTKGTVGTGLGLWVTRQIVDKHHGAIRMRSSTGEAWRGTVFTVTLPVEQQAMTQDEQG